MPHQKLKSPSGLTSKLARKYQNYRPLARKAVKFAANSSIPTILLVTSLLISRYLPNSDYSYPSEIILPIVLFAFVATIIFYLYRYTFGGKSFPAHIASFLLIYALYGFNYAFPYVQKWTDAVLPSSLTTSFSSAALRILLLGSVFWAVAYGLNWLIRHHKAKAIHGLQLPKVLLFAVCFIFAVQAVKLGARLWAVQNQLAYQYQTDLPVKPSENNNSSDDQLTAKPNVYYLLFDRYASTETLRDIYNFDNSALLSFFDDQGFVTRDQAYANYPFTQQSISSTLSMGYLSDLEEQFKKDAGNFQTAFPYRNIISDPPAAQAFKQNGYQYNQVSSWWDFTRVGIEADDDPSKSFRLRVLGLDFWLTDLQRDIIHKSAFSPLLQKGLSFGDTPIIKYDRDRNPRQNFDDQLAALQTISRNSSQQAAPQFTFAHLLSPHDPYIFTADGSQAPYNGDRTDQDVDEYVKYTNQLTYANTRIQQMISDIRTNDPEAIIVFQPDEGPYPKDFRGRLSSDHYFDPKTLGDRAARQKFGITASYYMPGLDQTKVKQELTSSVNVFPFILNNYLGYTIDYLPECNFSAGNKYVIYDYAPQTGRLRGVAEPVECQRYDK